MNNNVLLFIPMALSLLEVPPLSTILYYAILALCIGHDIIVQTVQGWYFSTTSTVERHEIQVNNRRTFCNIAHKKDQGKEEWKRMKY